MKHPEDRITLPPGPGDELTDRERLKLVENGVTAVKIAVNAGFGELHKLLGEMRDDLKTLAANSEVTRREVRRHSERIRAIEIELEEEEEHINGQG